MYSYKVEQAIRAAAILHQDQLRKGNAPLPFITHLTSVMLILRDYTTDEDVLAASLLHDTIEDTDYTANELREDFGDKVTEYVLVVTEPRHDGDKKIPWRDQKHAYAKQLKKGPKEAVMIAAADKIHNFRTIVEEYYTDHNRFLQDFGTDLDARLEVYQTIANVINSRLTDGIVHEFNRAFDTYKEFIFDVKESIE